MSNEERGNELNDSNGSVTYEVRGSWEGGETVTLDTWKCPKAASEDAKNFEVIGYDNVHINRVARHSSQNSEH
jgi:hypothetical protein